MATESVLTLFVAAEGVTDTAIVSRLVEEAGAMVDTVYGEAGKEHLLRRLNGYNRAAVHRPGIVLLDLDRSSECIPLLRQLWLPTPAERICLRIAVRAVEAWLLADREGIARFLGVAPSRIPTEPERLEDPKRTLLDLAGGSGRRKIKAAMAPRPKGGRPEGPGYAQEIIRFAASHWRPDIAAERSDSLRRCRLRLSELVERCR